MEKIMKPLFDTAGIERELHILERSQSQAETRTSLFNLVVIDTGDGARETEEKLLGYLLGKRAARIIHITLDTPGPTEVYVNARCMPDREDKGVCFQEIHISAGEDGAGTAPGSWSAFLIRDIPVYVLWMSDLDHREVLRHTREQADKFIIDGTALVNREGLNLDDYLLTVKIELLSQGMPTADLAWERLAPLRNLTARAFDFPGPREGLEEIGEIILSGPDAKKTELELFGLWIASRLGWTRAGNDFAPPQGGRIPCGIITSPEEEAYRILFRLTQHRELDLRLSPSGVATAHFQGTELLSKALALPEDGEIFLAQVDMPGYDSLYTGALELV